MPVRLQRSIMREWKTLNTLNVGWSLIWGMSIHIVFASPGTIAAYHKEGHFADGSVLVTDVYATATGEMTTGTGSHPEKLKGWLVMVRDSKNSHPGNKLWGDGWGWSWFDQGNPLKTISADYKVDCQPCHLPAQAS